MINGSQTNPSSPRLTWEAPPPRWWRTSCSCDTGPRSAGPPPPPPGCWHSRKSRGESVDGTRHQSWRRERCLIKVDEIWFLKILLRLTLSFYNPFEVTLVLILDVESVSEQNCQGDSSFYIIIPLVKRNKMHDHSLLVSRSFMCSSLTLKLLTLEKKILLKIRRKISHTKKLTLKFCKLWSSLNWGTL